MEETAKGRAWRKNKIANDAYRKGWDRIFGQKPLDDTEIGQLIIDGARKDAEITLEREFKKLKKKEAEEAVVKAMDSLIKEVIK